MENMNYVDTVQELFMQLTAEDQQKFVEYVSAMVAHEKGIGDQDTNTEKSPLV